MGVNIFRTKKPDYTRIEGMIPPQAMPELPPMPSPQPMNPVAIEQARQYAEQRQNQELNQEEIVAIMEYHLARFLEIYNKLKGN